MKINFSLLGGSGGNSMDKELIHPREIFSVLPKKNPLYNYPRDVQTEVWNKWFEVRDKEYNVIKMNTGSGKTIVGLLILKSCLNEGKGPAVYVVPDQYLVSQVMDEANKLGIEVTDDEESPRFTKGHAILVINVYKLFNGRSRFGVNEVKINIGSVIIDDAHACLDIIESQFTLEIPYETNLYAKLFEIFKDALKEQYDTGILELEAQDPNANLLVPYWAWQKNIENVTELLFEVYHEAIHTNDKNYRSLIFTWNFIKNCLSLCSCVFGSDMVEISPKYIPIDSVPSFVESERKIFMSATLSDDSILVSHFNISTEDVKYAITPDSSDDIGDRMILIPQELNPDITDEDIKEFLKKESKTRNVVVIVPSNYRAKFWADICDLMMTSEDLYEGISKLKSGHVGLAVMINKYDGIDLAKDACEILVIDGLPDVRRKIDKIEQGILMGTDDYQTKMIQKIEQGMGRGIRSKDDYCVVLLMGRSLINHLYVNGVINKFTPATKEQIMLSEQLGEQIRGIPIDELKSVIDHCLLRNTEWVSISKLKLVSIKYESEIRVKPSVQKRRDAFNAARIRDYTKSTQLINEIVNETTDKKTRGYYKQLLAEYYHFIDEGVSHQILKSAVSDNQLVLHPIEGIQYTKLQKNMGNQAVQLSNYLTQRYRKPNHYILNINNLLEQLVFKPGSDKIFEEAFKELAFNLGFSAQRPEAEYRKGPDVLWEIGNLEYLVIECKNGVNSSSNLISKGDCNQLNGSIVWFKAKYDSTCRHTPIMVHPYTTFEYAASPDPNIRIMNKEKLNLLKEKLHDFAVALNNYGNFRDVNKIGELLNTYELRAETFVSKYTVGFTVKS